MHGLGIASTFGCNTLVPFRGRHIIYCHNTVDIRLSAGHSRGAQFSSQLDFNRKAEKYTFFYI